MMLFVCPRPPSDGFDWIETEFQETIKMSSYLIGIHISDFECVSHVLDTPISASVNMSVCTRRTASELTQKAEECALEILPVLESYFRVAFPLPKLG